jgi:ABC-type lipoprotein export system ATPase subunit
MSVHVRPERPVIDALDVRKSYRVGSQTVEALRGVSLTILKGEFVAIMGSSGSGKTTLMNMLGTLDRPTSGDLRIAGAQVSALDDDQLAQVRNRFIGFVFQQFNLLPRASALQQVMLPLRYARRSNAEALAMARDSLARVGLADRMDHYPQQLSGGQQQRVAIARALVGNPLLILADEPTGALDTATSAEIMALLAGLNAQGNTVVLVTHDPEVAAQAHRRIVVRDGTIIEDSPTAGRSTRVIHHATA